MVLRLLALVASALMAFAPAQVWAQDQELAPICQRGAKGVPIPLDHVLKLEAHDYFTTHAGRVTYPEFDPLDEAAVASLTAQYTLLQAIEWPGVLADRAAELPEAAHDLPWLILLAYIESTHGDPVWSLTQGPESILVPHLLPMLDRHDLKDEARVLRMVMGLYPTWDADPTQRRVIDENGNTIDETLRAALDAASRSWPTGQNRARTAAMRLIEGSPDLKATLQARIDAMDDAARLEYLMADLWGACLTDWWDETQADLSLSRMGAVQAALILMDSFSAMAEGGSLYAWFDDSSGAHSEMLARLLDRRGLPGLAKGLRDGVALFPAPYPRNMDDRWRAMSEMDDAMLARFDTLLPQDSYDQVRAAMLQLARENGLLPP